MTPAATSPTLSCQLRIQVRLAISFHAAAGICHGEVACRPRSLPLACFDLAMADQSTPQRPVPSLAMMEVGNIGSFPRKREPSNKRS